MGNAMQKLPQTPLPPPSPLQQLELQQQQNQPQSDDDNREFTCKICIEPTSNSNGRFRNTGKCSHPFCTDCVIKYISIKLEDNNVGDIKCPNSNCDQTLDPAACAAMVGPAVFARWCDVLCESAILGLDKCYCPYSDCNVLIVNECGGNVKKSKCPKCKRWFCFRCKKVWHGGFRCKGSVDINDVAFERLVKEKNWKRCPCCRHFVELVVGCPTVKCRCGISFCYTCGNELKGVLNHWCPCLIPTTPIPSPPTFTCCELFVVTSTFLLFISCLYFMWTWMID